MDLAALVVNKPLLDQLSAEYEALKSSRAHVDYESWIKGRLRQAAASIAAARSVAPDQRPIMEVQQRQQQACAQQRLAYRTQMRQRQQVDTAAAALLRDAPEYRGGESGMWQVRMRL